MVGSDPQARAQGGLRPRAQPVGWVPRNRPRFEAVLRYGLLAPAGTPKEIIARLNRELQTLVALDEVKKRIAADGGDPLTSTPEEYAADIDREERKWGALVRKLGLKVE
jgi:tripartite-type tricarboxylate transporter receptor subunit TctC